MIDMKQAEALVHQLQQAEPRDRVVDPLLALRLQQARRDVQQAFATFDRQTSWSDDVACGGVVGAGVKAIARCDQELAITSYDWYVRYRQVLGTNWRGLTFFSKGKEVGQR